MPQHRRRLFLFPFCGICLPLVKWSSVHIHCLSLGPKARLGQQSLLAFTTERKHTNSVKTGSCDSASLISVEYKYLQVVDSVIDHNFLDPVFRIWLKVNILFF